MERYVLAPGIGKNLEKAFRCIFTKYLKKLYLCGRCRSKEVFACSQILLTPMSNGCGLTYGRVQSVHPLASEPSATLTRYILVQPHEIIESRLRRLNDSSHRCPPNVLPSSLTNTMFSIGTSHCPASSCTAVGSGLTKNQFKVSLVVSM